MVYWLDAISVNDRLSMIEHSVSVAVGFACCREIERRREENWLSALVGDVITGTAAHDALDRFLCAFQRKEQWRVPAGSGIDVKSTAGLAVLLAAQQKRKEGWDGLWAFVGGMEGQFKPAWGFAVKDLLNEIESSQAQGRGGGVSMEPLPDHDDAASPSRSSEFGVEFDSTEPESDLSCLGAAARLVRYWGQHPEDVDESQEFLGRKLNVSARQIRNYLARIASPTSQPIVRPYLRRAWRDRLQPSQFPVTSFLWTDLGV